MCTGNLYQLHDLKTGMICIHRDDEVTFVEKESEFGKDIFKSCDLYDNLFFDDFNQDLTHKYHCDNDIMKIITTARRDSCGFERKVVWERNPPKEFNYYDVLRIYTNEYPNINFENVSFTKVMKFMKKNYGEDFRIKFNY